MRILFDHCVPKPLKRQFRSHQVKTAAEMGWGDLKNGKLLAQAGTGFDTFITVDQNIEHEQNLSSLPVAVVVLKAKRNTPAALAPLVPFVEQVLTFPSSGADGSDRRDR